MTAKQRLESFVTTPIENIIQSDRLLSKTVYNERILSMIARGPIPSVTWFKNKLGKQDYCWTGSKRFWVWEFENSRLFASNDKGWTFEVKEGLNQTEAFSAWREFFRKCFSDEDVVKAKKIMESNSWYVSTSTQIP